MKKTTEQKLETEVWWWRSTAKTHPPSFAMENSAAFYYELACRANRKVRLVSFLKLSHAQVYAISGMGGEPSIEYQFRYSNFSETGDNDTWTERRDGLQWNLKFSNRVLLKGFLDFIEINRRKKNIQPDRTILRNRRKPLPWRWLELMDLADKKIRPLGDNERRSLSEARKIAKQKWKVLSKAIDKFKEDVSNPFSTAWVFEYPPFTADLESGDNPEKTHWKGVWPRESMNQ
ncbi:MAG: hypothetical protein RLZZ350_2386 [Verrucomicrobiota bacterium]|jgi:hypothetical protein